MRCPLFVVLILTIATVSFGLIPKVLYEWEYAEFDWDSEEQKKAAIESGNYNVSSCIFYDVDRTSDRTFVTIVRDEGVPASLLTVSNKMGKGGPLLIPYPDWSWYDTIDCDSNKIISVFRVSIKCNRMFVLDCGWIGNEQVCPAKLWIFNLEDDTLVKRIDIPNNISQNENGTGLLVTPLAYVRDCKCMDDVIVFMADIVGFGLVIYDNRTSNFCRIESTYMKPTNPDFNIENQDFTLDDGILGLTIIDKYLYYTLLAGNSMYKMDIHNIIQNCTNLNGKIDNLTQLVGRLSGQTAPIASEQCAVFFSNIPETSILCQDATKEFNSNNTELIAQNSEKLQFISGMKVTNRGKELIFLSNRFQRSFTDTFDPNETNFRILYIDIFQIRKTTNCFCKNNYNKPHGHGHGHHGHWPGRWPGHWPGYESGRWPGPGGHRYDRQRLGHFNKYKKYGKDDHDDKDDKDDKVDKYDKDDKHDKYDKQKL